MNKYNEKKRQTVVNSRKYMWKYNYKRDQRKISRELVNERIVIS